MAMATTAMKSAAGRPRESARRGVGYELSEWLDNHWDKKVGMTNEEVAIKMGYKAPNIVSMWRTGKTKVALDRLIEISDLMKVDLAVMLPMWFEQQLGEDGPGRAASEQRLKSVNALLKRITSLHEFAVIKPVRKHFGKTDPAFTTEQAQAAFAVLTNPAFADEVVALAKKEKVALAPA